MKPFRSILLFFLFFPLIQAQGSETESLFLPTEGRLIIPHLNVNNKTFYLELVLSDPQTFTFAVNPASLVNITPGETEAPDPSAIIGTWGLEADPTTTLTFSGDGSYELYLSPVLGSEECASGTETGQFQWDPDTGVLLVLPEMTDPGVCSLSLAGELKRIFVDGDTMTQQAIQGNELQEENTLFRQ